MSSQQSKLNPETLAKMRASQAARKEKNSAFRRLRDEEKVAKAANEPVTPAPLLSSVSLRPQPTTLGTDPKQVEAAAIARLLMRIKAAQEDPCAFIEFCIRDPHGDPIKLAPFQREWLYAMRDERRLLIEASRHHGKCQPGNARVLLSSGEYVRIDSLLNKEFSVIAYNESTSSYEIKRGKAAPNGNRPVLRFTTLSGRRVEVTEEHPLLTFDGYVPAKDLKVGDYIAIIESIPNLGKETVDPDIAWLLGALTGDGCLTELQANITCGDQQVVNELDKVCRKLGWRISASPQPDRCPTYRIARDSKSVEYPWQYLAKFGLTNANAYGKRVPNSIFKSTDEGIAHYLAGYFDTDAHVNKLRNGCVEFYSVSKLLLVDVQSLLIRLGIQSHLSLKNGRYKGNNHVSYRLTIRGFGNLNLFRTLVKSRGKRKEVLDSLSLPIELSRDDKMPSNWRKYIKHSTHYLSKRGSNIGNKYQTSKAKVMRVAIADGNQELIDKLNQPIRFVKITSVEDIGTGETFALEVEDLHNYITEDFITHNTTLLISFCLWMLGRNPNLRIKIFCQNDGRAQERVYELKQGIEKNAAVKLVFPNLKPSAKGEWTKTKLIVERTADLKDASVEAIGITTSATGGRVDVIVCDDICDMRNSITYPSMREQIKKKFFGELLPMLDPATGKALYIATPWSAQDLTAALKHNTEWKSVHYSIGTSDDSMAPLWPEKWPRSALEGARREMGVVEFDRAYRCVAVGDDMVVCKPEWIKYYSREILGNPHNLMCVQAYDLAIGQNSKADYFAGVTLLYDMERNMAFVADFLQTRCSFMEQANIIINNYNRWNADRVWVETTGLGGGMFNYLLENAPKRLPLAAYKPRGDKQRRLMEVSPWLENGYVYFHPNMDPQRHVLDADRGDIVSQLLEFPLGKHDDIVDALVSGLAGLMEFKPKEDEDGWNEGTGIRARLSVMG